MGGCKVHLSAKVLGLLKASKIMVLMFPSHLSHLLRPCDDDPFLKAKAHAYRSARALLPTVPAGTRFTLEHLMLFIAKACLHGLSPVHVINGFKNTGAWLMDAYQVEVVRLLIGMGAGYATRRVDLHRLMVRLEPKARREMDQPVVSFGSIPYREGAVVATSDGEPAAIQGGWWDLSRRGSCELLSAGKGSPGRLRESTNGARIPENLPSEALGVGSVG